MRYMNFSMGFHCTWIPCFMFELNEMARNLDLFTAQQIRWIAEDLCIENRTKMTSAQRKEAVRNELLLPTTGYVRISDCYTGSTHRYANRLWTVTEFKSEFKSMQREYKGFYEGIKALLHP